VRAPPSSGTVQTFTSDWRSGVTTTATVRPSGDTRGEESRLPFLSSSTFGSLPSAFAEQSASRSPRSDRT